MEQWTGSKLGKEYVKALYRHSAYYARVDEAQAGTQIARRNINNLRYADDTTLILESKEELKSLLMKVKLSQLCPTFWTPWTIQSMEFSR